MTDQPRTHLRGEARAKTAAGARALYDTGLTIRQVAGACGLSYGLTRNLLIQAGTELRHPREPATRVTRVDTEP